MKHIKLVASLFPVLLLSLFFAGCATRPPTSAEQGFFNIQTNYVPVVQIKTNVFDVFQTNTVVVTQTNVISSPNLPAPIFQVVYKTNEAIMITQQTNTVTITNQLAAGYVYTPGPGAKVIQEVGTGVGNIFGVGGIVGTALGALFSLWGYVRSKKSLLTATNLAQTIETIREFVKSLPNGSTYDNELINWMTTNQANAGVLQDVLKLLENQVSNPDAKEGAAHIASIIEALKAQKPTV